MKACHNIAPVFDDPNLVSAAGLVPVLQLAQRAGLEDLLAEHLRVASANPVAKARSVVAGMLAGADSIADLDLLRSGGMARVVGGVRAPSTLGTFLRAFTHGHVQQIDQVAAGLLGGLTRLVPGLLAGGRERDGVVFLDMDDTIRAVHGYAKQAAGFGYSRVRGLNVQVATASTPIAAPVVARARLRRGNIASHAGSARLLAQSINEDAWTPIKYPQAVWDDQAGGWVSDAQVAEVPFTAFTSLPTAQQITCRLVVRRVKRLQPRANDQTVQGELFTDFRHHAYVTNSTLATVEADPRHRDHAIIEQVIAELKDGPWPTYPPGPTPRTRLGRIRRPGVQPRPRRQHRRAYAHRPVGHPAPAHHHHPRPPGRHRPPARAPPTPTLALGHRLDRPVEQHPRQRTTRGGHHLTTAHQARPGNTT